MAASFAPMKVQQELNTAGQHYVAGGLEDADIRKAVCDILEDGEDAFRERARRLRVRLER
jgi:hypothetical protein